MGPRFKSVQRDQDRQETARKSRNFQFGHSAMDAMTSEVTEHNHDEKRNKDKLRKLSEQYRGKFPRIEGIHSVKEKAVAVLHFSAGKNTENLHLMSCLRNEIREGIRFYLAGPTLKK